MKQMATESKASVVDATAASSPSSSSGFVAGHSALVTPDSKVNFSQCEKACLNFWEETKAFQTQLKLSEGRPEYTFYDGPPFVRSQRLEL